jgi:hypothetical protein
MLKRFWRPQTGIFLAIWLILMIGGRSRFLRDPGTFWHTVVGQQMLSSGELIYQDTFSFTFGGQSWSPHQWLGECLMAIVHRLDALDSLLLVTVTLLAALYTSMAHRFIRAGLHWSLATVLVALVVAASSSHFHIRPHIGTIIFMGCMFGLLADFDAGRIPIDRLAWLVPISMLWANIHGGVLGGWGTVAFAMAGWGLALRLGWPSPLVRYRQLVTLGLLLLACALTALVNPYGLRLPQIWLEIMDSPVLPHIIQEHAPLQWNRMDGMMVILLAGLYVVALAGTLPCRPRVTWLLPFIWLYLASTRIRHAPLFAITAGIALADIIPATRWARSWAQSGSDWYQIPSSETARRFEWRAGLLPACVVLAALAFQAFRMPIAVLGHGWARLDASYWPVELLPELERLQGSPSAPKPIFNEYLQGGYLIYHTPGFLVFVDDRCELYGDRWLVDYVQAETEDTGRYIHECERRYPPFDLALTISGSGFDQFFESSKQWILIRRTEAGSLYRRASPAKAT